jgi:hypothetical protein
MPAHQWLHGCSTEVVLLCLYASQDARLRLQPKFAAVGGSIWTTSINNTFLTISGTSFSTPMAAGSMALWLQAKQGKQQRPRDSQLVADSTAAFINTAAVIMSPEAGWAEPIVRTGAGEVGCLFSPAAALGLPQVALLGAVLAASIAAFMLPVCSLIWHHGARTYAHTDAKRPVP